MTPTDVILEALNERWRFEGDHLVVEDDEGCFSRAAQVFSKAGDYPVRLTFQIEGVPEVIAQDEETLRSALIRLSKLHAFVRAFNPHS